MQRHFEYYIDDKYQESENTILYGKAIMIAMISGHSDSWTKFQKKVYFNHDTMTFKDMGSKLGTSSQNIHKTHKSAVKKIRRIIYKLVENRDYFRTI